MRIATSTLVFAVACVAALAPPAQAMTATQTIEVETVVTDPDGKRTVVRTPAETVVPGSQLVYSVAFTNTQDLPTNDLTFTLPVPEETVFTENSVEGADAVVTVSTDGGASFVSREAAMVMRDGVATPALAEDITHLRWVVAGPLAPGDSDRIAFKAVLK